MFNYLFYNALCFFLAELAVRKVGWHALHNLIRHLEHLLVVKGEFGIGVRIAFDVGDGAHVQVLPVANLFDQRSARIRDGCTGVLLVQFRDNHVGLVIFADDFQAARAGHVPLSGEGEYLIVVSFGYFHVLVF